HGCCDKAHVFDADGLRVIGIGVAGDVFSSICDNDTYYPQAVGIEDMRLIAAAVSLLRDHGPALRTLIAEHEALLAQIDDAPTARMGEQGVLYGQISPLEELSGQFVRILAEPGEVGA